MSESPLTTLLCGMCGEYECGRKVGNGNRHPKSQILVVTSFLHAKSNGGHTAQLDPWLVSAYISCESAVGTLQLHIYAIVPLTCVSSFIIACFLLLITL